MDVDKITRIIVFIEQAIVLVGWVESTVALLGGVAIRDPVSDKRASGQQILCRGKSLTMLKPVAQTLQHSVICRANASVNA
ncbi:hypothetical protein KC336_g29 [Hortaea werneckii]|nr:hypothetical protein KC336_g29 [Hortaea werneckii]